MKLLKAMATIASLTVVSRIAGMIRDILTASYLGAGPMADAFFVALKLPNLFRRVAAEGAFSVSFIPLYARTLEQEGDAEAGRFAGEVFSVMAVILSVFVTGMMVAMPWVIRLIAPGFGGEGERFELAVSLSEITFPYLMLIAFVALFGGVLNAHHRFAPFAAAPIVFNFTIIACLLGLSPFFSSAAQAMAVGVCLSGFLQAFMLYGFIRRHRISYAFRPPRLSVKTRELFRLMGGGAIAAGSFQIGMFATMLLASFLPEGSISHLYYADRLHQLPLSIGGIAVGTALLPMLSRALSSGNHSEASELYNRALEFSLFIGLPAAIALLTISYPIVATLFQHGEFTRQDGVDTALVLMGYGIGLPAYIAVKVFMTAFWAHHDTVTPVRITVFTSALTVLLGVFLVGILGAAGLSVALSVSGWVQVYLLYRKVCKLERLDFDARLVRVFPKIIASACIMGVVLAVLAYGLHNVFITADVSHRILALVALIGGGIVVYAAAITAAGVLKISDIKNYLKTSKG